VSDPTSSSTASEELALLDERRAEVGRRITQVERAWRDANVKLQEARAAVVEFERQGGGDAERAKLEAALKTAEGHAGEPWQQRLEGAKAAARDADADRRQFVVENLDELVDEREAAGAECAARINDHLAGLTAAYAEWHAVAQQIAALASSIGSLRPGDVSRTRAEQVVREAQALLLIGGEQGPILRHDPREPRHGQAADQVEVPAA
jgi:chromosome segregation ATPase